ncbi:MAG: hypothetical protein UU16_C0035G0031 [Candidatus Woesebacteria bacterium GW2011_GWA2_40_7]|uniref:Uncharacterized protein n=1 Tax=Candidatus Woesebacteria bacterium GW2011_GWA2_40_7 TaxID=1618562 RepID=A0A0G0VM35_9BACT|nr:MAG: hypothetical protein UU16_C0035G0031 [Candidatus Woesebacteria bacterium GW2011_GWA2_40_7]
MNKHKQAIVLTVDPRVVECPYCYGTILITKDLSITDATSEDFKYTDTFVCPNCHHVFYI